MAKADDLMARRLLCSVWVRRCIRTSIAAMTAESCQNLPSRHSSLRCAMPALRASFRSLRYVDHGYLDCYRASKCTLDINAPEGAPIVSNGQLLPLFRVLLDLPAHNAISMATICSQRCARY